MNTLKGLACRSMNASLVALAAQPFPTAAPAEVGISAERLQRVDEFIERQQLENKLAGAVTLIARHGKLVSLKAHGYADLEARRPVRVDDLFNLQSMTKPIATVAALQLMEEGRLQLADAISKFLPEFSDIKVAVGRADAPDGFDLVPMTRPITVLDLMTHRAGFTGLPPSDTPAARLRREALKLLPPNGGFTLEQYVSHLAASPLESQPGIAFRYGPATIVLGRVIEVLTGQTLDSAFRERIFRPLDMTDTFFAVPEGQRARVAPPYALKAEQGLTRVPLGAMDPTFLSAGGNLFGTAIDYLRFCQMLLNGGELNGIRVLSRQSVDLMTTRQVDPIPLPFMSGQYFGLGVAVLKADGQAGLIGSPGTFGWSGAYNTYFRVDPSEKLVVVLMTQLQLLTFDLKLQYGFHNTAMQVINDWG
jgi:CubicO group peptidase (beta-lactamase class C family)